MYKIGLIGCGRISHRHCDILINKKIKKIKLVSVCDVNIDKAKRLSKKFNLKYYSDMNEMIREENLDIVAILTESGNHCKHVCQIAKFKINIIVEKPMALTVSDCKKMINICKKYGSNLMIIKQNRFNLPVVKLKKAIEKNVFGKLFLGTVRVRWCRDNNYYSLDKWRGTWKMDGGVLANQAIHHIDLLEWLVGKVDKVFAVGSKALTNNETEDTALVILKFKNKKTLGLIEATTATRPNDLEGSISILGEKGNAEIGGFAVNKLKSWNLVKDMKKHKIVNFDKHSENPPNVYGFGHEQYYKNVLRFLEKKEKILVDGHSGLRSVLLVQSIYKSIETGKEVKVRENNFHSRLGKH